MGACLCKEDDFEAYDDPARRRSDAARIHKQIEKSKKLRESLRKKVTFDEYVNLSKFFL